MAACSAIGVACAWTCITCWVCWLADELVTCGSDDGRVFIYRADTGGSRVPCFHLVTAVVRIWGGI
jgi:hypothetical protein